MISRVHRNQRGARRLVARAALAAAAIAAAIALAACGTDDGSGNPASKLTPEQAAAPLEGAPPALAAIRAESNQLLDGGADAFEARLAELRGFPVVVNKWASWCVPCREEFPYFQALAAERGDEIAFLGVNTDDSEGAARSFLEELPLPYPSYVDPDRKVAKEMGAPRNFPATAFYDSSGELIYTFQGVIRSEEDLEATIERYLG